MTKHARISASKIERAYLCPASVSLEEQYPDSSNEAAERGTWIHKIAETILRNEPYPTTIPSKYSQEEVNEMLFFASSYVEFINSIAMSGTMHVEVDLTPMLSTIHPDFGGTADAVIVHDNRLTVIDLKTGRVPVSAKNNLQLKTYALGALMESGQMANIKKIELIIFQGPLGVSYDEITTAELLAWGDEMTVIAYEANDPFAQAIPGNTQCKYCKAKQSCPALKEKANMVAKNEFFVPTDEFAGDLDLAELVVTWAEAVQAAAKAKLADGGTIEGWELKPGRKTIKFANKTASEAYLAGNHLAFEIKSPAALKKLGIELPEDHLVEERYSPTLSRKKNDLV